MKTAEEILSVEWDNYKLNGKSFKQIAIEAMKLYANQKLDEAGSVASEFSEIIEDKILSLKDKV